MNSQFDGLSEADRNKAVAWVEAHGISADDVPADARFELRDGQLTIEVVVRDADGNCQPDPVTPNSVARTTRTVRQVAPLPQFEGWRPRIGDFS